MMETNEDYAASGCQEQTTIANYTYLMELLQHIVKEIVSLSQC